MTKLDAIREIVKDARATRGSRTSMLRLERALKVLGLSDEERLTIMRFLDYYPDDGTEPFDRYK